MSCADRTSIVQDIRASGNNLDGTLPIELGDLDQLTYLDLGT